MSIELPPNPWRALPECKPFVLPSDAAWIDVFNEGAPPHLYVRTNLIPEPYFGPFGAPIVILLLNPGVDDDDEGAHASTSLRDDLLRNVRRADRDSEMRHTHLKPGGTHPGALWWQRATRQIIEEFTTERVSESVLAVEYFPYHSKSFGHGALRLPSQHFGFTLVRRAISRNALIVLTRGREYWFGAVPELAHYPRLILTSNLRRFSLSSGNVERFAELCAAIASPQ